jgi:hypothetical protein
MAGMPLMLGECRRRGRSDEQGKQQPRHAASSSRGRTVTTRIMPACMW